MDLSAATEAAIADGHGEGTIRDDDEAKLSIDDVTVAEGDSGTVNATFTIGSSNVSDRMISVDATTADATATAPADYAARTARLSIPAGETTSTLTVAGQG